LFVCRTKEYGNFESGKVSPPTLFFSLVPEGFKSEFLFSFFWVWKYGELIDNKVALAPQKKILILCLVALSESWGIAQHESAKALVTTV
jgi:hypothetical protein